MLSSNQLPIAPIRSGEPLVIGLVNNMPDAALRATERQFHDLLAAASSDRVIRLRHFSLLGYPRTGAAQAHIEEHYEDPAELWASALDGVIVTGTEPRASVLTGEPYWTTLTKLIDWANGHTISTVWSCLAAHAAVLHLDGIERQRLPAKLSGVFGCVKFADHPIVADLPSHWCIPHSRYNDLPNGMLTSRGYQVLSQSAGGGADLFIKYRNSLDVFFQGHPEYEPDTLLREYRRDVGRFLAGETGSYPDIPSSYFGDDAVAALAEFREKALCNRDPDLLHNFPMARVKRELNHAWREPALRMYSNWMSYLAEYKSRGLKK